MTDPQVDVNTASVPSANAGVPAAPPAAAPDVNSAPAPSADGESQPKPHEQSVPYERFSEVNEKLKQLQDELEAAKAQQYAPDDGNGQIDWNALGLAPDSGTLPAQQAPTSLDEEFEQRIRDDMYAKPYATFAPIITELARQVIRQERAQESQVRRIPDFRNYESSYYNIPDEIVQQTQNSPEVIRFLIAKHQATLRGTPPPPMPASMAQNSNYPPPQQVPSAQPAKTMDDLRKQYLAEGERLAMEKVRGQQGVTSESAQTYTTPQADQPELDDYGKQFMKNLGISEDKFNKVAGRLAKG